MTTNPTDSRGVHCVRAAAGQTARQQNGQHVARHNGIFRLKPSRTRSDHHKHEEYKARTREARSSDDTLGVSYQRVKSAQQRLCTDDTAIAVQLVPSSWSLNSEQLVPEQLERLRL